MNKHEALNILGQKLMGGDKIASNNEVLLEYFGCSSRTLKRYLEILDDKYALKKTLLDRVTYYSLETRVSNIVHEYLSTSEDMTWLIQMINSSDKTLFSKLEEDTKERLENILSSEKDIFLYQNSPFELLEGKEHNQLFRELKLAVKNNEYRDIHYSYNSQVVLEEVQCLKLIFMENNWYVAIATKEKKVLFLRISFIKKIEYSSNKISYQSKQLDLYRDFFKTFQNPMTLFGQKKQKAHLLASSKVAKYFKPDMKKLLTSQTFIEERSDGSVEFTLDYTQSMEILPLIKKWLPDLKILSPKSLDDEFKSDLHAYLQ
ncbi:MAG: Probable transcription regulator Cj0571 [uncultured Sulfurovum sp.]|uniref:Probable transcription regulator Cj0571 n=1 Tax=uncultured Sulfurovum sp. TaxID=269237 RepID=A0A6S6TKQ6_9BACT|nr:MAG: Probable transcription regulator Cj0571 [uncultured Sulfurovum sp.]